MIPLLISFSFVPVILQAESGTGTICPRTLRPLMLHPSTFHPSTIRSVRYIPAFYVPVRFIPEVRRTDSGLGLVRLNAQPINGFVEFSWL
jgi:hypothetical protein